MAAFRFTSVPVNVGTTTPSARRSVKIPAAASTEKWAGVPIAVESIPRSVASAISILASKCGIVVRSTRPTTDAESEVRTSSIRTLNEDCGPPPVPMGSTGSSQSPRSVTPIVLSSAEISTEPISIADSPTVIRLAWITRADVLAEPAAARSTMPWACALANAVVPDESMRASRAESRPAPSRTSPSAPRTSTSSASMKSSPVSAGADAR